jgi:hypothetical protein
MLNLLIPLIIITLLSYNTRDVAHNKLEETGIYYLSATFIHNSNIIQGVRNMAEFCECGSLIIESRCSNKGCPLMKNAPAVKRSSRSKTSASGSDTHVSAPKKPVSRRASKVITYNLYDTKRDMESEK